MLHNFVPLLHPSVSIGMSMFALDSSRFPAGRSALKQAGWGVDNPEKTLNFIAENNKRSSARVWLQEFVFLLGKIT